MPLKLSKGLAKPSSPAKPGLRLKKSQGPSSVAVNSVSSEGRLKLKRTDTVEKPKSIATRLKLVKAEIRKEDLAKKKAAGAKSRNKQRTEQETPLASLEHLDKYVRVQLVTLPNGRQREWPVISATAAADPLLTTAVTISRWLSKGLLPKPVIEAGRGPVFHLEELRSFCEVLGQHLTETMHYRANHTETKKLLFDENLRIRKSLFDQAV